MGTGGSPNKGGCRKPDPYRRATKCLRPHVQSSHAAAMRRSVTVVPCVANDEAASTPLSVPDTGPSGFTGSRPGKGLSSKSSRARAPLPGDNWRRPGSGAAL